MKKKRYLWESGICRITFSVWEMPYVGEKKRLVDMRQENHLRESEAAAKRGKDENMIK